MARYAFTNSKTGVGSNRSPERTRPLLLPRSPAPHGADGSPASADEAPPAQSSSGHPAGDRYRDRSGEPSCGSPGPSARTPQPAPPAYDPHARAPPVAAETP